MKIVSFENIDELIDEINNLEKSLTCYYFGNPWGKTKEWFEKETSTGMFVVNETVDFE